MFEAAGFELLVTPEEFRRLLGQQPDEELLSLCLTNQDLPFVCENEASWNAFRDELVGVLNILNTDVRVVGSGRLGFSLKPWNNLRVFRDESDIDVAIVNANLFDQMWMALLTAAYPRDDMVPKLGGWLSSRRNELYTGWLSPLRIQLDIKIVGDKARHVLGMRQMWFDALKKASNHASRRHESISGRLYRTWKHAELYHLYSLGELRRSIAAQGGA